MINMTVKQVTVPANDNSHHIGEYADILGVAIPMKYTVSSEYDMAEFGTWQEAIDFDVINERSVIGYLEEIKNLPSGSVVGFIQLRRNGVPALWLNILLTNNVIMSDVVDFFRSKLSTENALIIEGILAGLFSMEFPADPDFYKVLDNLIENFKEPP